MRKLISLIIGMMLFVCLTAGAKTSILIDFDLLKANGDGINVEQSLDEDAVRQLGYNKHITDTDEFKNDKNKRAQHMPTLVDYSAIAGSNFDEEQVKVMNTSLCASNWEVKINSSANSVESRTYSKVIEWHTKYKSVLDDSTDDTAEKPEGYNILGVRIHFPETPFNCWALIKPPFEIPAYENSVYDYKGAVKSEYADANGQLDTNATLKGEDKGSKFENGYGIVKNVGIIKSIDLSVYGCQFKNSISLLMKDERDITTEYMMPQYLDYDGWRVITWTNPNYIEDARDRDLYILPLYPQPVPFVKVMGFRIYRQGDQIGGDFVTYIKDVKVTYDEAVYERDAPIDHEDAWGILEARREVAKKREYTQLGKLEILRYLERQKMDTSN